jgi:hypothetical protein
LVGREAKTIAAVAAPLADHNALFPELCEDLFEVLAGYPLDAGKLSHGNRGPRMGLGKVGQNPECVDALA